MRPCCILRVLVISFCLTAFVLKINALQQRPIVREKHEQEIHSEEEDASLTTYDPSKRPQIGKLVEKALLKCAQGVRVAAKLLSSATAALSAISRHAFSEVTRSIWFDKANEIANYFRNGSARSIAVTSARGVMLSTYVKTPQLVNTSLVLLDSFAQFSLEKAVEAIDIGGRHAEFVGKHAGALLSELSVATERIIESEYTKKFGRALRFHFENLLISSKQASILMFNRALWSIAEHSHWVKPVVRETVADGTHLTIFADANNLYTAVPVWTKGHQYLGTFALPPAKGYMACAAACRDWTKRTNEACLVNRMRFGLGPRCSLCHSFVWYAPEYHSGSLAAKCFAISSASWTLTYEINAFSGRFHSPEEDPVQPIQEQMQDKRKGRGPLQPPVMSENKRHKSATREEGKPPAPDKKMLHEAPMPAASAAAQDAQRVPQDTPDEREAEAQRGLESSVGRADGKDDRIAAEDKVRAAVEDTQVRQDAASIEDIEPKVCLQGETNSPAADAISVTSRVEDTAAAEPTAAHRDAAATSHETQETAITAPPAEDVAAVSAGAAGAAGVNTPQAEPLNVPPDGLDQSSRPAADQAAVDPGDPGRDGDAAPTAAAVPPAEVGASEAEQPAAADSATFETSERWPADGEAMQEANDGGKQAGVHAGGTEASAVAAGQGQTGGEAADHDRV